MGVEALQEREIDLAKRTPDRATILSILEQNKQDFVYQYTDGKRTIKGISWLGARALAYWFRVNILDIDLKEREDSFLALVKAEWEGRTAFGGYVQPKVMKLRDGDTKDDTSAMQKAINKAQRNAILNLLPIPKTIVEEMTLQPNDKVEAFKENDVITFEIPSELNPKLKYVVKKITTKTGTLWSCSCPGFTFNGECKHIKSVKAQLQKKE